MADDDEIARVGFLIDGDPDTELMAATYTVDDLGVRLTVPFEVDDIRGRWWSGSGVRFGDDPDRTRYSYDPPTNLDYFDWRGRVALLGCLAGSSRTRWGTHSAGAGVIQARYAVEGAGYSAHYVNLNGLRSEMDGLADWLGISPFNSSIEFDERGAPRGATTKVEFVEALRLARRMNLRATFKIKLPPRVTHSVTYRSTVHLESFVVRPAGWVQHLALHRAVRDLLRISSWKQINFQSHQAASMKESVEQGGELKRDWKDVRTATTGVAPATRQTRDQFLFEFGGIGSRGVAHWLNLVNDYERGLAPFVGLLDLEGATIDAHISQLGIAIEAIGYQALISNGMSSNGANNRSVEQRIKHLVADMGGQGITPHEFASDFATTYNSVKHANRAVVDVATKVQHYREGVRMLRAWVAVKVGVTPQQIVDRL